MTVQFASLRASVRYLEIPKAACCSIKAALLASDGIDCGGKWMHNHAHWREIPETFKPEVVFTFVRHPFSRLESSYREKCRTGKIIDHACDVPKSAPFHEWVDYVTSQDPQTCNRHWRPQSVLLDQQQAPLMFCGSFENLAADWERLRMAAPGLPELPHVNKSEPHPISWDGISIDKAEKFYAEDFDRFGYSIDTYLRLPRLEDWKDVDGFMHPDEGAELQRLARGKRVLEIGVWKGRSTIAMAATAAHVVAVDHFRGDGFAGYANTCNAAWENLCETGARERVTVVAGDLRQTWPDLDQFGFIHYDADHTYEATAEWLSAFKHVSSPIAVHDYDDNPNHAGCRKAVDEFAKVTGRRIRTVRRLAVLEKADV